MTVTKVDVGALTEEQTEALAFEAMSNLPTDTQIKVIKLLFGDATDRGELIAHLEDMGEATAV